MNGIEGETWLLEYEGSLFVFVAGQKDVVLGWDVNKYPLGDGILEGLREEFSEGHKFYQGEMEDLREVIQEQIKEAQADGDIEKTDQLRLQLTDELESFEETIEENGYGNWENFMSKWNEHLSQCLSPLRTTDIGDMIVEVDSRYLDEDVPSLEVEKKPMLEQPNMLGLFIAYNSYKCEIIDNISYTKGGDGGGSLCLGFRTLAFNRCLLIFHTLSKTLGNQMSINSAMQSSAFSSCNRYILFTVFSAASFGFSFTIFVITSVINSFCSCYSSIIIKPQ